MRVGEHVQSMFLIKYFDISRPMWDKLAPSTSRRRLMAVRSDSLSIVISNLLRDFTGGSSAMMSMKYRVSFEHRKERVDRRDMLLGNTPSPGEGILPECRQGMKSVYLCPRIPRDRRAGSWRRRSSISSSVSDAVHTPMRVSSSSFGGMARRGMLWILRH